MKKIKNFPKEDGHIESILIGYGIVKVSFQTWDCRQLILIYSDVEELHEHNSVFGDIGQYIEDKLANNFTRYKFKDADDAIVLEIEAKSLDIIEVGHNADINTALFDVGYDYIGNQTLKE